MVEHVRPIKRTTAYYFAVEMGDRGYGRVSRDCANSGEIFDTEARASVPRLETSQSWREPFESDEKDGTSPQLSPEGSNSRWFCGSSLRQVNRAQFGRRMSFGSGNGLSGDPVDHCQLGVWLRCRQGAA